MMGLGSMNGLFRSLGAIAEVTGRPEFYARLAENLAAVWHCRRWLVMRYGLYGAPELVVNNALPKAAVNLYLKGLYRLDPLLSLVQSGKRDGAFIVSDLRQGIPDNAYFERILRLSLISDEAAILLATPGNSSIAICLDRATRRFGKSDRLALSAIHPLIRSLHLVHLDRTFSTPPRNLEHSQPKPFLILDKRRQPVYRSESWLALERQGQVPAIAVLKSASTAGVLHLGAKHVLHWETLPESFAVAPGGRICTIEAPSAGYINTNLADALDQFRERYRLTRRQTEIVQLVLRGHPNSRIAVALDITKGTVRNYRFRLYDKLDITTERELFFLFISHLLGQEGMAAAAPTPEASSRSPSVNSYSTDSWTKLISEFDDYHRS